MLNQADTPHDNLFGNTNGNLVQFLGIITGICRNRVDCFIQQVSLRRADFAQCPVGAADKIITDKRTGCVCSVRCHQLIAPVNAIYRPCKAGIPLGISGLPVCLSHFYTEFFQDISKTALSDDIPLDRRRLGSRNHIPDRGVGLFQSIWGASADQHIFKTSHTGRICYGILIHRQPRQGRAIEMECHILHKLVL